MPDLVQSLAGEDLGHLNIIAELWGVEFSAPDTKTGLIRIKKLLLDNSLLEEILEDLPDDAQSALYDLVRRGGRMSCPLFSKRYGSVREMGVGRRDREQPYLSSNASPAEALWYRALVGRSFFDTPNGPEEFIYIPDDLLALIPHTPQEHQLPLGQPSAPRERAYPRPASDWILDDACTLLAALRTGYAPEAVLTSFRFTDPSIVYQYSLTIEALNSMLSTAGLLDVDGNPKSEPVQVFLEAIRGEALLQLFETWKQSAEFNELHLIPGLTTEGEWTNDPEHARKMILEFLSTLPGFPVDPDVKAERPWWSLDAFVEDIKQTIPDFQRPAGDYDSWYIRADETGEFLRGFKHWDEVDGALIRYIICGPLHWLGVLDLASPSPPQAGSIPTITAFRFSQWAADILTQRVPGDFVAEDALLTARSDARLRIPMYAPRAARYQVNRFCTWEGLQEGVYNFRLTPHSLQHASQQGLRVEQLVALLRRYCESVPPSLVTALKRWEFQGSQVRIERDIVLRVRNPEILKVLRESRAARFLGDPLGSTAVVVNPGAWEKVITILAELGYLGELDLEEEKKLLQ